MYIRITSRCNMECEHCGFSCTAEGQDMTLSVFKKACALAEDYGSDITIGGGEPTLHKNLFEMIGLALASTADIEMRPFLVTNGKKTEIALKLAKMAKGGILGVELSQDDYHDTIDDRVIKAFTKSSSNFRGENENDLRGIRNVKDRIMAQGRAHNWGTQEGCLCEDMVIDPDGKIYACGCREEQFGTVQHPQIPDEYYERDEKCTLVQNQAKEWEEDIEYGT